MAIAFVAAADLGNNGGSTNSLTHSYTCGSGANRLLIVGFQGDASNGNDDITGVTYAGVSMTLVGKANNLSAGNRLTYMYYLLNPASGANNVVISSTNNHYLIGVAADYTGVKQSAQPDNTATQTNGLITSDTVSLTTVADNCWTILVVGAQSLTASTGETFRVNGSAFTEPYIFDSNGPITPAGSYSMTTTTGVSQWIYDVMASFAPAAGSGGFFGSPTMAIIAGMGNV